MLRIYWNANMCLPRTDVDGQNAKTNETFDWSDKSIRMFTRPDTMLHILSCCFKLTNSPYILSIAFRPCILSLHQVAPFAYPAGSSAAWDSSRLQSTAVGGPSAVTPSVIISSSSSHHWQQPPPLWVTAHPPCGQLQMRKWPAGSWGSLGQEHNPFPAKPTS